MPNNRKLIQQILKNGDLPENVPGIHILLIFPSFIGCLQLSFDDLIFHTQLLLLFRTSSLQDECKL